MKKQTITIGEANIQMLIENGLTWRKIHADFLSGFRGEIKKITNCNELYIIETEDDDGSKTFYRCYNGCSTDSIGFTSFEEALIHGLFCNSFYCAAMALYNSNDK